MRIAFTSKQLWILPIISGLFLGFSWPETGGLTLLMFFAFVPLMYMEFKLSERPETYSKWRVFISAYICFLLFNVITTWWIQYASLPGMIMAELFNSLFMAIIFLMFSVSKRRMGLVPGYLSLLIFWLAFEWIHFNWELSWVWLTLGNVFANQNAWVQWYEWTGVMGGSFWVLLVNIMIILLVIRIEKEKKISRKAWVRIVLLLVAILVPITVSYSIFRNYIEEEDPMEVVVVQPNIDPYNEKFYGMSESDQIDLLVALARAKMTSNTDFVVCPETAFPMGYWEHELHLIYGTEKVRELIREFPKLRVVTGLSTKRLYAPGEKLSATARSYNDGTKNHYDFYNTAIQYDASETYQLYHKSKLVLGVEKMPFGTLLKPLEQLSINLGGASGSLGAEDAPINFTSEIEESNQSAVAPVICYESVYGDYVADYVRRGAEVIFIITNDGWWDDTPGYRQHLAYAKIRAIETRRSIARSANTGISAFIDQRGEVHKATGWWKRTAIRHTINASNRITFYVKHGDFIGRVAAFFALLVIALVASKTLRKKNKLMN